MLNKRCGTSSKITCSVTYDILHDVLVIIRVTVFVASQMDTCSVFVRSISLFCKWLGNTSLRY